MNKKLLWKIFFSPLLFLFIAYFASAVETFNSDVYNSGSYGDAACGDDYCDSSESCSSCSQDCGSCPSNGGSGSSASGGSGGGIFSGFLGNGTTASHKWRSIKKGSTVVMKINKKDICVKQLDIEVKNTLSNAEIKVEKLEDNPTKPIKGKVYQYLFVDKFNIEDSDLYMVIIKFNVDEKWLEDNNFDKDDIVLKTFRDGRWKELPTKLISEGGILSKYFSYEADSSRLSYFAIGVKETAEGIAEEDATQACIAYWECTSWSECSEGKRTRECSDINNCGTTINKPSETEDCCIEEISEEKFNLSGLSTAIIIILVCCLIYIVSRKKSRKKRRK